MPRHSRETLLAQKGNPRQCDMASHSATGSGALNGWSGSGSIRHSEADEALRLPRLNSAGAEQTAKLPQPPAQPKPAPTQKKATEQRAVNSPKNTQTPTEIRSHHKLKKILIISGIVAAGAVTAIIVKEKTGGPNLPPPVVCVANCKPSL